MATPEEQTATMIANLKVKTGKTLEQWLALVKKSGLAKHGEIVKHLKGEHEMTHGFANLVAHKALSSDAGSAGSGDELIEAQYAGKKAGLRPIYDALVQAVTRLGKDVELAPKKAYVSVRRSKQFALFQPSTAERLDVGLNLKSVVPTQRLEAAGSFSSMVTHRVRLSTAKQVDKELAGWLKQAYEEA